MSEVKRKLNRSGSSHTGRSIRIIDTEVFGVELSATERVVFNALYSFMQKGGTTDFTFSEIRDRYKLSYSSVCRAMHLALDTCFRRLETDRHAYKPKTQFGTPKHYFYIEDWLHHATFNEDGNEVSLTYNEIEILAYITHQNRHIRNFNNRQATIARTLGIAPSTVSCALAHLEKLAILVRTCSRVGHSRAANQYDAMYYTINDALMKKAKKAVLTHVMARPAYVTAADTKTDRERFYAERQRQSNRHMNLIRTSLQNSETGREYLALEAEIKKLGLEIAKAELQRRLDLIAEINTRINKIRGAMAEKLSILGLKDEDLQPRFICPHCQDTGFLPDGHLCNCYIPPTSNASDAAENIVTRSELNKA